MSYGQVEYTDEGLPICELCGKAFDRVIAHVRQKHKVTARDYKQQFGLDVKKGICSKESALKSREAVAENYDKVVRHNLVEKGATSRFELGSDGRKRDKMSKQTLLRLQAGLKNPNMVAALKVSGTRLGLSGIGNKVRWKK